MNHPFALVAALLLTGLSFSATARAETASPAHRQVGFTDLDLSTPAGVKALERRIERAANSVCLDGTGPGPTGRVDPACKTEALDDARRQLAQATRFKGDNR